MNHYKRVRDIVCPECTKSGGVCVATTEAAVELDAAYARCRLCSYAFSLEELLPILRELTERREQTDGDDESLAA